MTECRVRKLGPSGFPLPPERGFRSRVEEREEGLNMRGHRGQAEQPVMRMVWNATRDTVTVSDGMCGNSDGRHGCSSQYACGITTWLVGPPDRHGKHIFKWRKERGMGIGGRPDKRFQGLTGTQVTRPNCIAVLIHLTPQQRRLLLLLKSCGRFGHHDATTCVRIP